MSEGPEVIRRWGRNSEVNTFEVLRIECASKPSGGLAKTQMPGPLLRVSDIVSLGRTWEHIFLPSFQACKWRCSKGHPFRTITWDFPLTLYSPHPLSFSLPCAKDFFLQPLVPWFSLRHKTFVFFLPSLSNKINSLGYQRVWAPDFTSCYPVTYEDSSLEVLSSH